MTSRILFTCELGAGLSYGYRMAALARRMATDGHEIHVVAPPAIPLRLAFAGVRAFFHRPPMLRGSGGHGYADSYADILLRCGWSDSNQLASALRAWGEGLRRIAPTLIVAEFAPVALLAARIAGIPVIAIGTGYTLPPAATPMPFTQAWNTPAPGRLDALEHEALQAINIALARLNAGPLPNLAALFDTKSNLLCGFPELSHYPQQASHPWIGPIYQDSTETEPVWPPRQGERVFAYLHATHPHFAAVLQAITIRRLPTVLFAPGLTMPAFDAIAHEIGSAVLDVVRLHLAPVCLKSALAGCDIVVCHGVGTLSAALVAGKRVLHLPGHLEQDMVSHRLVAGKLGIGVPSRASPERVGPALDTLLTDLAYLHNAVSFAEEHRTGTPELALDRVTTRIRAVLAEGA